MKKWNIINKEPVWEVVIIRYEHLYAQYKDYLVGIAYRMLGTVTDAEDVVQEVFLNLSNQDWGHVSNVKSYIVKITVNRCLNVLKSSARQRERYLGPWLPEPILGNVEEQPEELAERKEQIRYAVLVMLQTLSPQERAIFILKEILGFDYSEIAKIMERTESNCRKIVSRAKQKLNHRSNEEVDESQEEIEAFATLFIHAIQTGNYTTFVQRLLEEVMLITDGGGKTKAAYKPIYGADRVLAFLKGVTRKGAFHGDMTTITLNGEPGIRLTRQGCTVMAISFQLGTTKRIESIYVIMNPEKLRTNEEIFKS